MKYILALTFISLCIFSCKKEAPLISPVATGDVSKIADSLNYSNRRLTIVRTQYFNTTSIGSTLFEDTLTTDNFLQFTSPDKSHPEVVISSASGGIMPVENNKSWTVKYEGERNYLYPTDNFIYKVTFLLSKNKKRLVLIMTDYKPGTVMRGAYKIDYGSRNLTCVYDAP